MAAASGAPLKAATQLTIPPPPRTVPKAWTDALSISLGPAVLRVRQTSGRRISLRTGPPYFSKCREARSSGVSPGARNGHALLVLPGGAYWFVSAANEGAELASRLTPLGITVFVLTYRLPGEGWKNRSDVPLQDAQRAMRAIRSNVSRFGIDATKVSVLGFSAGAASRCDACHGSLRAGLHTCDPADGDEPPSALRGADLPRRHNGSASGLTRCHASSCGATCPARRKSSVVSAERHVIPFTPQTFIVHAYDDDAVQVENSLRAPLNAMREARWPVDVARAFRKGARVRGVGYPGTPSARMDLTFSKWLSRTA